MDHNKSSVVYHVPHYTVSRTWTRLWMLTRIKSNRQEKPLPTFFRRWPIFPSWKTNRCSWFVSEISSPCSAIIYRSCVWCHSQWKIWKWTKPPLHFCWPSSVSNPQLGHFCHRIRVRLGFFNTIGRFVGGPIAMIPGLGALIVHNTGLYLTGMLTILASYAYNFTTCALYAGFCGFTLGKKEMISACQ